MKQSRRTKVLLSLAVGLLALVLLQSCAPAKTAAKTVVSGPPAYTLPANLAAQLKQGGFAIAATPFVPDDFTLASLDGSRRSLTSYKGNVVLLSFWATWCGPCKEELPSIQALYDKLSKKGFVVLAVDIGEDKEKVAHFVKNHNLTFPVLLDGDVRVGSSYGASSIPTNYLVDRQGRIIARIVGYDGSEWTSAERLDLFDKILQM
jgi:thiol-disulfide isomerase/thioredoxin